MADIAQDAQVTPTESAARGASKLFFHLWETAFEHARATRDGDAKALHDMRVSLRRLRTAMSNFEGPKDAPLLSKRLRLELRGARADIGKLGDKLGAVRDFDVLEDYVRDYVKKQLKAEMSAAPGLAELLETLQTERDAAFLPMQKAHKKAAKADGLREEFGRWALGLPAAPSQEISVAQSAKVILSRSVEAVFALENSLDEGGEVERQHELRRALRRVRYTLETLSVGFEKPIKPFLKTLIEMQDTLGEMQDRAVLQSVVNRVFGAEKRPADVARFLSHGQKRQSYLLGHARKLWKAARKDGFWEEMREL